MISSQKKQDRMEDFKVQIDILEQVLQLKPLFIINKQKKINMQTNLYLK